MKNKLTKAILLFCAIASVSCKDKNAFVLSGEIENPQNIKKVYLLETDSTRISIIDSAALSDQHKFSFKHSTPYANLYKLKVGEAVFDLIAQNGDDIEFKTNVQDTSNAYQISGSKDSEKVKEFNKISNHYGKITEKLVAQYKYKTEQLHMPEKLVLDSMLVLYKKNQKEFSNATLDFMKNNKTSLAGFYASGTLDPAVYERQLIAYADDIKNEFQDNLAVQQFKKRMEDVRPLSVGRPAPDFTLIDKEDKPVKLSDYKGKYLMLDFWASWCAPCRQENPNVVKMYARFKDKGLNILGISLDENRADWEQAIKSDNLTWRHAGEFKRFDGPVVRQYKIEAIPSNFIIDPQGVIVAKNITGTDLEEFFNKTFTK